MVAYIHPHKPTKERPTQSWAVFDEYGKALAYAHELSKVMAWLTSNGYEIEHKLTYHD